MLTVIQDKKRNVVVEGNKEKIQAKIERLDGTGLVIVSWHISKYDEPFCVLRNRKTIKDAKLRKQIQEYTKEWLAAYFEQFQPVTSPVHLNPSTANDNDKSTVSSGYPAISGVPPWMREKKVYVKCHKKDGSTYLRRTRFDQAHEEEVRDTLPHCSTCPLRATCHEKCKDPATVSQMGWTKHVESFQVAGVTFDDRQDMICNLLRIEEAELVHEKENGFDLHAIKVMIGGNHIGYVPRKISHTVQRLLENHLIKKVSYQIVGGGDLHYGVNLRLSFHC